MVFVIHLDVATFMTLSNQSFIQTVTNSSTRESNFARYRPHLERAESTNFLFTKHSHKLCCDTEVRKIITRNKKKPIALKPATTTFRANNISFIHAAARRSENVDSRTFSCRRHRQELEKIKRLRNVLKFGGRKSIDGT